MRHVGGRLARGRELNDRAVTPQALQCVEHAVFVVLDVDDDIRVVKQDPAALAAAFAANRTNLELLGELVFDLVDDRIDLALGGSRGNQECIGDAETSRRLAR